MEFFSIFKHYILKILYIIFLSKKHNFKIIKRGNIKWKVKINDVIGSSLFFLGYFEKKNIKFFKNYILNNTCLVDVGANIGAFAIPFYFTYKDKISKAYAIEPDKKNFSLLNENLKLNGIKKKIKALNYIISYNNKVNKIYSHYPILGDTKKGKLFFREGNTNKVKKRSLDDLNFKKKTINYILKIDVDGNEYHVIKSAKKFIRINKPLILVEISKSLISKLEFESIINFLESCNYKILLFKYFKFSPKILKFDPRNLGIDYFFIPKNFKKKIR